jgi:hypothetical protein
VFNFLDLFNYFLFFKIGSGGKKMIPLLIVDSFYARDIVLRVFKLKRDEAPTIVEDHHVDYCREEGGTRSVMITVPRVPNGVHGFWNKAKSLFPIIHQPIFVYNKNIQERPPDTPFHVKINADVLELCHVINAGTNFVVSDEDQITLSVALSAQRNNNLVRLAARPPPPVWIRQLPNPFVRRRLEREDDDDDEEDPELTLGIELSLQEQDKPLKKLRLLPSDWKHVLKEKSEPIAKEGDPVCKVCMECRPSICFVECGHQVACDECVRIMWTESKIHRVCIVCKTPVESITRPIL